MSNKYQTVSIPLTEEIKQLRWRLKQIEEARNYWQNKYKQAKVDFSFTESLDYELSRYKIIADALASELKETEQERNQLQMDKQYWKKQAIESNAKNKQLRSALIEQDFYSFSKAEMWKITADVLATELEQMEQQLWDDKKWIESYSSDAEYWKEQAIEARKNWTIATNQRNQLKTQLRELYETIRPYAYVSKHIYREMEDTEILLEQCKEDH